MTLNCLYLLVVSPPRDFQIRTACWRIFLGLSALEHLRKIRLTLLTLTFFICMWVFFCSQQCCKNKPVHTQLHTQALRWRSVHAKPTGGDETSQRSDVSPNQKPEEKNCC